MKRLAAVAALWALAVPAAAQADPYVVTLRDSVSSVDNEVDTLRGDLQMPAPRFRYGSALKGFSADLTADQVARLRRDPAVAFVQPDVTVVATGTEPLAAGELAPAGLRRIGAASPTEAHGASTTNVAGIIAARNTGSGVVGVAPGTRVYSVKVLNSRSTGTLSQFLCGINWVAANAAALNIGVANMSIAGPGSDDGNCGNTSGDAEHKAICAATAAGVSFVVAAGNSGTNFATSAPAAYPEVLTATAMTDTDGLPGAGGPAACARKEADDRYASFSNYAVSVAAAAHAIAAPGTCVVSSGLGGKTSTYSGTSQAAPHVAGTLALCRGSAGVPGPCADLSAADAIAHVRSDAAAAATTANGFLGDPLRPLTGKVFGPLVSAALY